MSDKELFLYLGICENTFFYFHKQNTDHDIIEMTAQVYNKMIADTMIRKDSKVLIFNFMRDKSVIVTLANHIFFSEMKYSRDVLVALFNKIIKADRKETMVISYDGIKYETYYISSNIMSCIKEMQFTIDKIKKVYTNKNIPFI